MKLASLKHGRDGKLLVVSRDLTRAQAVADIAPTLQAALDSWSETAPSLMERSARWMRDEAPIHFPSIRRIAPRHCRAPINGQTAAPMSSMSNSSAKRAAPRCRLRFGTDPADLSGGSYNFIGPADPICVADESWGIDFESEIAVVTDDVAMGVSPGPRAITSSS